MVEKEYKFAHTYCILARILVTTVLCIRLKFKWISCIPCSISLVTSLKIINAAYPDLNNTLGTLVCDSSDSSLISFLSCDIAEYTLFCTMSNDHAACRVHAGNCHWKSDYVILLSARQKRWPANCWNIKMLSWLIESVLMTFSASIMIQNLAVFVTFMQYQIVFSLPNIILLASHIHLPHNNLTWHVI